MPVDNKEELVDFSLMPHQTVDEVFAEHFYKQTRAKFDFPEEVSNRDLWELLKKVGNAFRLIPNNAQNGRLQQQRLNVEARKERWIAAGMEITVTTMGMTRWTITGQQGVCLYCYFLSVNARCIQEQQT